MGKQTAQVKNVYRYLPLSKDSTAVSLTCRDLLLAGLFIYSVATVGQQPITDLQQKKKKRLLIHAF